MQYNAIEYKTLHSTELHLIVHHCTLPHITALRAVQYNRDQYSVKYTDGYSELQCRES